MKIFFLVLFLMTFHTTFSQKILSDKIDPFTGVRTISTGLSNLKTAAFTAIVQSTCTLDIKKDSIIDFMISFLMPDYGTTIKTNDTTTNFICLLKTDDNLIVQGKYLNTAQFVAGTKFYQAYTYIFNNSDIKNIKGHNCTDLKFFAPEGHQCLIQIDANAQYRLSKQCNLLLDKANLKN